MLHPPRPQDEMEDYLSANLDFEVQKMEREGFRISYILEWWYLQRHRWPTLSQFAIEILSIPAMSDDVERVFSGARRTISWE